MGRGVTGGEDVILHNSREGQVMVMPCATKPRNCVCSVIGELPVYNMDPTLTVKFQSEVEDIILLCQDLVPRC